MLRFFIGTLRVIEIYWEHRGVYGYRRIYAELVEVDGYNGSSERIRRRMRHLGLRGIQKRKFKATPDSQHDKPVYPNVLQQFEMTAPDQAWVCDITYIRVGNGWLYLVDPELYLSH